MYWGSALSLLAGIAGGVLAVVAVIGAGRGWAWRRTGNLLGLALLLVGLSLSGVIDVVARALAILAFNPLRWLGLVVAGLGLLLMAVSGALPRRRTRTRPARERDDDLAEIHDILRRRGIE